MIQFFYLNMAESSSSVVIIDYGVGNHRSVFNALALLGVSSEVTDNHSKIRNASHIILPGVGSFGKGMQGLHSRGLVGVLQEEVLQKEKPILGICLGMQLLASEGFEYGHFEGLNFIEGQVEKIETNLRLPHIGWNDIQLCGNHSISSGFDHDPIVYFVHSFHFLPKDKSVIAGISDYGAEVTAMIEKGNVYGVQFHPEKSHDDGMYIFKNFLGVSDA